MCSVHRGKFGALGGVRYIGGCSVNWEVFSTSGGYHDYIGGYHEYIGGGGGCSVHQGDIMVHLGDIMSTWRDVQYIGGIS